jgi:hypothetical protein
MQWFHRAADQGYANAQHHLGLMYRQGIGVVQNYAVAAWWIRKAAEQGDTAAQTSLGEMYLGGLGVARNNVEAAKWFGRGPIRATHPPKTVLAQCSSEVRASHVIMFSRRYLVGFHSRASRCASTIWSGVI